MDEVETSHKYDTMVIGVSALQHLDIDELLCMGRAPSQDELLPAGFREKFGLGKVYQLGLVARDAVEAAKRLEANGVGPFMFSATDLKSWIERGEKKSFRGKQATAFLGEYNIEILEAGSGSNVYADKIRPDGKISLHHLGFFETRIEDRVRIFNKAGIETFARCKIPFGPFAVDCALMDSEKAAGIMLEFIQYSFLGKSFKPYQPAIKWVAKTIRRLGVVDMPYGD